ncbi:dihydrofolate reductase family protein [Antribacter sp. KLBMP9083]|uniref:Dihydrofolate reductase family protein n=1 Tax=Antribacter soli TaxID=2910976 RepID=A0AA41QH95_9MICO|nr:dihydrofolate reductase family protein [Antribacter soli]MCF4119683.1 dihydrofolate reductase family protein [Antribacter soli]MCF4123445.1 dihydrofolate reductase family protein [Antribacter soli]
MATRPRVLLSSAMSIDGYIDDTDEQRLILSNDEDWERVDSLRAWADAILIGAGTLRSDNPRLRVRSARLRAERRTEGRSESPVRVVLTATGDIDPDAAFFAGDGTDRLVYSDRAGAAKSRRRLGSAATVVDAGSPLELAAVLADLEARGIRRLLVEGGGSIHTQFLAQGLVDELHLVTAPFFIGDARAPRFVGPGPFPHGPARPLRLAETRPIGDLVYSRYLAEPAHRTTTDQPRRTSR